KQRGVTRRRYACIGRGEKDAGAVEMQADPVLPCKGGDPLHFGEVEDLALEPAHRGFYRDHAYRGRDASFRKPGDLGLDLGEGEGRALWSQGNEGQPAQLLRAVTGVVVDMTFALHENPAAMRREKTQRQMIGERTAR